MNADTSHNRYRLLARASVLAEILLLLIGGALLARLLAPIFGLPDSALTDQYLSESPPLWSLAALNEAWSLSLRYGLTLFIALGICWWLGGPGRKIAGLSTGNYSLSLLIGIGLLLGLLLSAPVFAARLLHQLGWGAETPMWALMRTSAWTPDFWLFMAVGSFGLVPIVEELFFRSYALGRLRMHFSAGAAIVLSALIFWIAHGQYLILDSFLLFNSFLLLIAALFLAWSVVKTGSVIPAIVAHAVGNIPMTSGFMLMFVFLTLIALFYWRQVVIAGVLDLLQTLRDICEWRFISGTLVTLVLGAILVQLVPQSALVLAGALLLLTLAGLLLRLYPSGNRNP